MTHAVYTSTAASVPHSDDVLVCMTRAEFGLMAHGFMSMARRAVQTGDTTIALTNFRLALEFGEMAYPDSHELLDAWRRLREHALNS